MVDQLLVPGYYKEEVVLSKKALEGLSGIKRIVLFSSVQFSKLKKVIKQLKDIGVEVVAAHGKRTTGEYQLLGCDCYDGSFEPEIAGEKILYIGDGLFHPKALLHAGASELFVFNPISDEFGIISQKEIDKELKKYKANLLKFIDAKKIGVFVSSKYGQEHMKSALKLKKQENREVYLFLGDNLDSMEFDNFSFVDAWVNTACPRIGFDDIVSMSKPLVNINDSFNPREAITKCK